jgi:hypothetical protein
MKIRVVFFVLLVVGCAAIAQTTDPAGVVPAAAPWWLSGTINAIEAIPVVGPIIGQVIMWFGIILTSVTALVAAARAIITALQGAADFAGLDKASAALDSFQNSSTMYWLKYIAGFTKPATPTPAAPATPAQPSK